MFCCWRCAAFLSIKQHNVGININNICIDSQYLYLFFKEVKVGWNGTWAFRLRSLWKILGNIFNLYHTSKWSGLELKIKKYFSHQSGIKNAIWVTYRQKQIQIWVTLACSVNTAQWLTPLWGARSLICMWSYRLQFLMQIKKLGTPHLLDK